MKRKLGILALAVFFILTSAVTGTLANAAEASMISGEGATQTSGNVQIKNIIAERGVDLTSLFMPDGSLSAALDDEPLHVAVYDDAFEWNGCTESSHNCGKTEYGLWCSEKISNALDRMVFVKNTGEEPVYFRTWIALEADTTGFENLIHKNLNRTDYNWSDPFPIVIGDTKYEVLVATYASKDTQGQWTNKELPSGYIAPPSLLQIAMDKNAGNAQMSQLGENFELRVFTQAANIIDLDSAFNKISEESNPWIVTDAEPINNEINLVNGETKRYSGQNPIVVSGKGTLILDGDLTITATGEKQSAIRIAENADVTIEVLGKTTLTGASGGSGILLSANANLELTGSGNLTAVGNARADGTEGGHGIGGEGTILIDGLTNLTAEGWGVHGFGIGGESTSVTIRNTNIQFVKGGFVQPQFQIDEKYGKEEPEGGAAIGSSYNGAVITLENVNVTEVKGGSKAAGIGAQYHTGVTINISNCNIKSVVGGNASAGIGGSRVGDSNSAEQDINITITDSIISATGGQFAAGIGSGYDTYCHAINLAPTCTINISGNSVISATGGERAAGIGTGYHTGGLIGNISATVDVSNVKAGEGTYKPTEYTQQHPIGFGILNPNNEGKDNQSYIYVGTKKLQYLQFHQIQNNHFPTPSGVGSDQRAQIGCALCLLKALIL